MGPGEPPIRGRDHIETIGGLTPSTLFGEWAAIAAATASE